MLLLSWNGSTGADDNKVDDNEERALEKQPTSLSSFSDSIKIPGLFLRCISHGTIEFVGLLAGE